MIGAKTKYGDIPLKIKHLQEYLETLKNVIPSQDTILKIKNSEETLDEILKQEELLWSQRAKAHWLKYGDLNTKYFHHKASMRKRNNFIYIAFKINLETFGRMVQKFILFFPLIFKIFLIVLVPLLIRIFSM
jgi:uncharacterized phage infection (PIP) family protein YhgE